MKILVNTQGEGSWGTKQLALPPASEAHWQSSAGNRRPVEFTAKLLRVTSFWVRTVKNGWREVCPRQRRQPVRGM